MSQNLDSEVRLAILDTRDFDSMPSTKLISTYSFASGSSAYQERARKKFLFGEPVPITQNGMLKIMSLVPPDRKVTFIGHDIQHDLRALDLLNFDFSIFNITILDTQSLCKDIISHESHTLRRLLLTLGCPFTKLHCGGNDADFTLKALLLLAVEALNKSEVERRLAIIKEIALSPLPYCIRLQTENLGTTSFSHTDSQTRVAKRKPKITTEPKAPVKGIGHRNARENTCRTGYEEASI